MDFKQFHDLCDGVARKLMDEGKLIAAGWHVYRTRFMPRDAGPNQVSETRIAFFAGAQHVLASITGGMDEDHEPTAADLKRMDNLHQELAAFAAELSPTKGRG